MGISALASVEQCGPPKWSGTVHTHIALYSDNSPSTRFSGQDRVAMRLWYDRWQSDGVFCLIYSNRDAHCEADGVVGGMRRGKAGRVSGSAGQRVSANAENTAAHLLQKLLILSNAKDLRLGNGTVDPSLHSG
jgi:hypothetical protein